MHSYKYIFVFLLVFCAVNVNAQKDSTAVKKRQLQLKNEDYNPLSPSKAAFYSAIFPGGGQIYNKKY